MMPFVINLFFPIATTMFLLHVRNKYSNLNYLLASLPFLLVAVVAWLRMHNIVYYYEGPLQAAGFRSWAAPLAVLSIMATCSWRTTRRRSRVIQGVVAVILANACIEAEAWIA